MITPAGSLLDDHFWMVTLLILVPFFTANTTSMFPVWPNTV